MEMCFPQSESYRLLYNALRNICGPVEEDVPIARMEQIWSDLPRLVELFKKNAPPDDELLSSDFLPNLFKRAGTMLIVRLESEAKATRKKGDFASSLTQIEKLLALYESGSLNYFSPEDLEHDLALWRRIKLHNRLYQAFQSRKWKEGLDCCEEWQRDYKPLWEETMESSDANLVLDLRDICELYNHSKGLTTSLSQFHISNAYEHLEKLRELSMRQQKQPEWAGRKCPKVPKEMLDLLDANLREASLVNPYR